MDDLRADAPRCPRCIGVVEEGQEFKHWIGQRWTCTIPDDPGSYRTRAEAELWVARYEQDRCPCGGSPTWVRPDRQLHTFECDRDNRR